MAPAVPPVHGFRDACLKVEIPFSLGFMKPSARNPFAHPGAFGVPGTGGSFGFADPDARIGFAYIPNRMGVSLQDPRELALRTAMWRSVGEPDPYRA
jgi:CubicO group peptidase (beta-lactamase class C family)